MNTSKAIRDFLTDDEHKCALSLTLIGGVIASLIGIGFGTATLLFSNWVWGALAIIISVLMGICDLGMCIYVEQLMEE